MRALTLLTCLFFLLFIYTCSTESTQVYNLTTSVNPPQAGSVTQSATGAEQGETITVAATANENWYFTGWSGDHSGSQNPASIVMDRDKSVTALFDKQQYRLTVDIIGEGEVEQRVVQARSQQYPFGTIVELTAVPQTGWAFSRWEGDVEGNENPVEITIEEEAAITAVFEVIDYPLTVNIIGEGRVDQRVVQAKTTEYPYGTVVELTATGDQGWAFLSWDGDLQGGQNPETITVDQEKEVTVEFVRAYTFTTIVVPQEGGSISPQAGEYVRDTTFDVEANPASGGWRFTGWEGDYTGMENPFSLTMNGNKTITANFERESYALQITIEGEGTVEEKIVQSKSSEYGYDTVVELTPVPSEGWSFTQWGGDVTGSDVPATITMDGEKQVTAVFEINDYSLTLTIEGEGSVDQQIVSAKSTDYPYGTAVELTALPSEGWAFWDWSGDLQGSENPQIITITEPKEVTATFLRTYKLTTLARPQEGGTVAPKDTVLIRDSDVQVEAIASYGWQFVNWEGDFSGSVNPFNLTMNGNKTLTAHFERAEFTLEIETQGDGSVDMELISGTQTTDGFLYESVVRLTALPDEGWNFIEWQGDATGEDETIEITIEENVNITAVFSQFAGGDGTAANPYHVETLEQLQRVGSYLDKHFIQIADIDASETREWIREPDYNEGFIPIGSQSQKFTGSYDGQDYVIEALYMLRVGLTGLFGYLQDGILKNVKLKNISINLWGGGGGGLTGVNDGFIENVSVSGRIFSGDLNDEYYLGGIAGVNLGTIHKSQSNAAVWSDVGTTGVGGLAGKNEGEISESHTSGGLYRPSDGRYVLGGLVGINSGTIIRSYSTTEIDEGALLGGLVGVNTGNGLIMESYATGNISGICEAGGLVALNQENAIIRNSYSSGDVHTHNILCGRSTGGLVGSNIGNALIEYSFSLGNVVSGGDGGVTISVGGLAGVNESTIREVYSVGEVKGYSYENNQVIKGGLIGSQGASSIVERSYWDIIASGLDDAVGTGDGTINEITGLQTDQMTGENAIDNMPEFDWVNIWRTTEDGYPILRWQD